MSTVIDTYTKEAVFSGDLESCYKFITQKARDLNHGVFRFYEYEGLIYFDCGPRTYSIDAAVEDVFVLFNRGDEAAQ